MKLTLTIAALVCMAGSLSNKASADQPAPVDIICQHVEEIRCATADMKDEIKCHFRGAKGYGRMLATNAVLKSRASAIHRRINRDSCYRRLERDAAKLRELACELQERFDEILACSTFRRPVYGELGIVQAKIDSIRGLADCVQVEVCRRLGKPIPVSLQPVLLEPANFAPSIPAYAPGARIVEPFNRAPAIEPLVPQQSLKSVLETNDPIIRPPGR